MVSKDLHLWLLRIIFLFHTFTNAIKYFVYDLVNDAGSSLDFSVEL
jgi:hypothetical protein